MIKYRRKASLLCGGERGPASHDKIEKKGESPVRWREDQRVMIK